MTPAQPALRALAPSGPGESFLDRVRREIRLRSLRAETPAVDLEARIIATVHDAVLGASGEVAGPRSRRKWADVLLGRKPMHLADWCRLATNPAPYARLAADRALEEMARARGKAVAALAPARDSVPEAAARLSLCFGELQAAIHRACADGRIDDQEQDVLLRVLGRLTEGAAGLRASVVVA